MELSSYTCSFLSFDQWHRTLVVFAKWPSGPPGPVDAAVALAASVTKAISAKGRRPAAANTLLSEVQIFLLSSILFAFRKSVIFNPYSYLVIRIHSHAIKYLSLLQIHK